jgi:hypothetical protein
MMRSLLLCLLSFGLLAQNTVEYRINPNEFESSPAEYLNGPVVIWDATQDYGFLGPSAYSFQNELLEVEIRFKVDQKWLSWQKMSEDHHGGGEIEDRQIFVLQPIYHPIQAWQIRTKNQPLESLFLRFFWAPKGNSIQTKKLVKRAKQDSSKQGCTCPLPPICDRDCWCPNGNCPPPNAYSSNSPTHLIVHHSAGFTNYNDYQWVVSYYWDLHVNTNGWSDIGYNWLVDPNGIIYEARGSGNLGAHFSCLNEATVGLCFIGDYRNNAVADSGLSALAKMLLYESCLNGIELTGSSLHSTSQLSLKHISGHRDANSAAVGCPKGTTCPGQVLYDKLDSLALDLSQKTCITGPIEPEPEPKIALSIFPNPATEVLEWSGTVSLHKARLINSTGESIELELKGHRSFDISNLAPGIYLLEAQWNRERIKRKIMIL